MINNEDLEFILGTQRGLSFENKPSTGLLAYQVPALDLLPQSWEILIKKAQELSTGYALPIILDGGKDPVLKDLYDTPNVLIAGTIASGKTQLIYNQILLWLYSYHPLELKLIICRSKPIDYNSLLSIERHFLAKVPSYSSPLLSEGAQINSAIGSLLVECDYRLDLFRRAAVKTVNDYNKKFLEGTLNADQGHRFLPNMVLIMDDLQTFINDEQTVNVLIALSGKNARTGIYMLCLTSQITSRKLTTALRANFSMRIAMKLMSQNESKRIVDRPGAEKLDPSGELLYEKSGRLIRAKQPYIDYASILQVTSFIGNQSAYSSPFPLPELSVSAEHDTFFSLEDRDPLFEQAARLVVQHQQGSTSLIQRKLKLGYNRTGRIIDQLEAACIVGPFEGSKAREVLYPDKYALELYLSNLFGKDFMRVDDFNLSSNLPISPATKFASKHGATTVRQDSDIIFQHPTSELPDRTREPTAMDSMNLERHNTRNPFMAVDKKVPHSPPKKKASVWIILAILAILLYMALK